MVACGRMTKVADLTVSACPTLSTLKYCSVVVAEMVSGTLYTGEPVVGVEPSVVYWIAQVSS